MAIRRDRPTRSVLFLVTKMRTKNTNCDYCGKQLEVKATSNGPHYCTTMCEQMRKESEGLDIILSTDHRYTDIEDLEEWANLTNTKALNEEDKIRLEAEAIQAEARKRNLQAMNSSGYATEHKTVYDFNGEVFGQYAMKDYQAKLQHTMITKQKLRSDLQRLCEE